MNIYILGKIGTLNEQERLLRQAVASQITIEGNYPINFSEDSASLTFEDTTLELVKEISYLVEADAVWLMNDFNQCEDARMLLAITIRLDLPVHPCNDCIVPPRICFDLKF